MHSLSLGQPYPECVELECLLRDAPRRLTQAREQGILPDSPGTAIHVVGSGFSAVLAFHALRSRASMQGVHDPAGSLPGDIFGKTPLLPLDSIARCDARFAIVLAVAPRRASEMMARIDQVAEGRFTKILLFSPDDDDTVAKAPEDGWIRLNMSYRCVNFAVNVSRRYRAIPCDNAAATAIMGNNLAGLLARMALFMTGKSFAGFVEPGQDAPTRDSDLLVTFAPHTLAGMDVSRCAGRGYASAQFLFRQADAAIPAAEMDGFTDLRLARGRGGGHGL